MNKLSSMTKSPNNFYQSEGISVSPNLAENGAEDIILTRDYLRSISHIT